MIKIGCCLNMNAIVEPATGAEAIPLVLDLGFDYFELPLAQVMELWEEGFKELLEKVNAGGIPVEACNNFFPARFRLTGEEARHNEALEYVRAAVDRAADVGVKLSCWEAPVRKIFRRVSPTKKPGNSFHNF